MNRLELKIIRDVVLKWNGFGGMLVSHVQEHELPTYHFLVDVCILEISKHVGQIEVYSLTEHGWFTLPKNFRESIKREIEKKHKEARKWKRLSHIDDYLHERQHHMYHTIDNHRFCRSCFNTTPNMICQVCNNNTFPLDVRARVPRKAASKKKWQDFLTRFQPDVLFNPNWWKMRNSLIC